MKNTILIALLVCVLVAAAVPMQVTGVVYDRHGLVVVGKADCHSKVVAQSVKASGDRVNVTLVAKRINGRVCDGARGFGIVVSQKFYKTVCVNGKCFNPKK